MEARLNMRVDASIQRVMIGRGTMTAPDLRREVRRSLVGESPVPDELVSARVARLVENEWIGQTDIEPRVLTWLGGLREFLWQKVLSERNEQTEKGLAGEPGRLEAALLQDNLKSVPPHHWNHPDGGPLINPDGEAQLQLRALMAAASKWDPERAKKVAAKMEDSGERPSARKKPKGTGNAILAYVAGESIDAARRIVEDELRHVGLCDVIGRDAFSLEALGIRLHATVALKVGRKHAEEEARVRAALSALPLPPAVQLACANIQRDADGVPYSINLLLTDDAASPLAALKAAFISGIGEDQRHLHDRYYPRPGHITLVSAAKCAAIFGDEGALARITARLDEAVKGSTAAIEAVGFPREEVKLLPPPQN